MQRAIAYIRVFVTEHGQQGPGQGSQRTLLTRFAVADGFDIEREYVDIERGTRPDLPHYRPILGRALARARWLKVPLIVADWDILARDARSLAAVLDPQIRFIVVGPDDPAVAVSVAAFKSTAVSATRGNPRLADARKHARASLKRNADAHAASVEPLIREAQAAGHQSLRKIAGYLTTKGASTVRGGAWSARHVSNILARLNGDLNKFLDSDGKIIRLPRKRVARRTVLQFLAGKFSPDTDYTEAHVNATMTTWHTFDDPALLRRELVDAGLLKRTPDGKTYWVNSENDSARE